jgi:hypothetical protein
MSLVAILFPLVLALCVARVVRLSAAPVQHTSLGAARRWLIITALAVLTMNATDLCARGWPQRTADYGWYLASILLLCPPIAVLGARRPGVRVWTWFILIPMLAVLSWPVWTILLQGAEPRGLALELPTVLGFVLVLIMGVGNYLGTRHWRACLLYFAGTLLIFLSCTGWSTFREADLPAWRLAGTGLLAASAFAAGRSRGNARHPVNRVWDDFRDTFGLVWSLRMVERINAYAGQEQWTIRMTLDGFPETKDELAANADEARDACQWLFRRFVDDQWINQRLKIS